MTIEEIIQLCKDRGELEFFFNIAKQVAESDSIGESYSYCREYTKKDFNNAEKHIPAEEYMARGEKEEYDMWLEYGAIPIYEIYLHHIGALPTTSH